MAIAVVACIAATPARSAELRKGPYLLLEDDPASMVVLWQVDGPAGTCTIEYGSGESYESGPIEVEAYGEHQYRYTIEDLEPGALHHYRVTEDLLEPLGVDLVLGGHNHYYARDEKDGVTHITSGGGGAPLHNVEPHTPYQVASSRSYHFMRLDFGVEAIAVTVVDIDGDVIDEFEIGGGAAIPVVLEGGRPVPLEYVYPIWVFLDGVVFAEMGNVFDTNFGGFSFEKMALSWGIGISTIALNDITIDAMIGFGSSRLDDPPFRTDEVRFIVGFNRGF